MTARVYLFGVPFDPLRLDEAAERVVSLVASGGCHLVVTANPELVVAAQSDRRLAEVVRQASLVVADGIGVVWASRWMGTPLPERVPGIELMETVCGRAATEGWSVFFLGGLPGVADQAAQAALRRWPGLRVAGAHHGYFREDGPVVEQVARSGAHLLFCGIGSPRQELWLSQHLDWLGVRVAMGVGGSLDVLAGRTPRAPSWVRRLHLEWLYRLAREPRRWRRQLALPRFAWMVLRSPRAGNRRGEGEKKEVRGA
ncbi:MAG: WecB/TagA/CpsF family glycosyltransferase [Armatimonadota bacterium]|nr:WecB/TagA/CpsF family glycosyltransferase [Armatimonadota bacterium]MDW8156222.1 WecB/TagA/CpsF family glycosyltransferase [Armatimonadota bacterium]